MGRPSRPFFQVPLQVFQVGASGRDETDQQPDPQREGEGEGEHRPVERDFVGARERRAVDGLDALHATVSHQDSERPSGDRQDEALADEVGQEPGPSGSKGHPHRELPLPRLRAHQK